MRSHKELRTLIPVALGITILILDSNTAIQGARAGLEVCLRTVIPSLFPFLFLSSILTATLSVQNRKVCRFLCHLYQIPQGAEGILLTGLLGGYPVGAKSVADAVTEGRLSSAEGARMIVFCNAAGPAFLFGIIGQLFSQRWIPWCLWGVHLLSGVFISRLLQPQSTTIIKSSSFSKLSATEQLQKSIQVMGEICAWIILIRIVITVVQKWLLWSLSKPYRILISGILELSNGCIFLQQIDNKGLCFLLCSIFLGFGGLCVALQTRSVASVVSQRMYIPGKFLQATFSFIVAYLVQYCIFNANERVDLPLLFISVLMLFSAYYIYSLVKAKKMWHFSRH